MHGTTQPQGEGQTTRPPKSCRKRLWLDCSLSLPGAPSSQNNQCTSHLNEYANYSQPYDYPLLECAPSPHTPDTPEILDTLASINTHPIHQTNEAVNNPLNISLEPTTRQSNFPNPSGVHQPSVSYHDGDIKPTLEYPSTMSKNETCQDFNHQCDQSHPITRGYFPSKVNQTDAYQVNDLRHGGSHPSNLVKQGLRLKVQQRRMVPKLIPLGHHGRPGGGVKNEIQDLTKDEERRRRRRERNKVAAEKCRMKKRERTALLIAEGEVLECQHLSLQEEVQRLHNQLMSLQRLLQEHTASPNCSIPSHHISKRMKMDDSDQVSSQMSPQDMMSWHMPYPPMCHENWKNWGQRKSVLDTEQNLSGERKNPEKLGDISEENVEAQTKIQENSDYYKATRRITRVLETWEEEDTERADKEGRDGQEAEEVKEGRGRTRDGTEQQNASCYFLPGECKGQMNYHGLPDYLTVQ